MINKLLLTEGQKPVLYLFVFAVISYVFICDTLAVILLALCALVFFIYRIPLNTYMQINDIVAPCDGTIFAIDKKENQQSIYVKIGLCDAHILRAPKSSSFSLLKDRKGQNLCINSFKAKKLNHMILVLFEDITIELYTSSLNTTLSVNEKENYEQNENFGVLVNGIAKITLPSKYASKVNIGQKIYAGTTVLA